VSFVFYLCGLCVCCALWYVCMKCFFCLYGPEIKLMMMIMPSLFTNLILSTYQPACSLRSQNNHLLSKLSVYTSVRRRAFCYATLQIWNAATRHQSAPLNVISKLFILLPRFNLRHVPPVTAHASNSADRQTFYARYKFFVCCMMQCLNVLCNVVTSPQKM